VAAACLTQRLHGLQHCCLSTRCQTDAQGLVVRVTLSRWKHTFPLATRHMLWVLGRYIRKVPLGRLGDSARARALSSSAARGHASSSHVAGSEGAHANATFERWRLMSALGALPVLIYGVWLFRQPHEHAEPPPPYPYLRRRVRDPAFPWGNHELLGTPWDHESPHAHTDSE
jgi:hypothetical protein